MPNGQFGTRLQGGKDSASKKEFLRISIHSHTRFSEGRPTRTKVFGR